MSPAMISSLSIPESRLDSQTNFYFTVSYPPKLCTSPQFQFRLGHDISSGRIYCKADLLQSLHIPLPFAEVCKTAHDQAPCHFSSRRFPKSHMAVMTSASFSSCTSVYILDNILHFFFLLSHVLEFRISVPLLCTVYVHFISSLHNSQSYT